MDDILFLGGELNLFDVNKAAQNVWLQRRELQGCAVIENYPVYNFKRVANSLLRASRAYRFVMKVLKEAVSCSQAVKAQQDQAH